MLQTARVDTVLITLSYRHLKNTQLKVKQDESKDFSKLYKIEQTTAKQQKTVCKCISDLIKENIMAEVPALNFLVRCNR